MRRPAAGPGFPRVAAPLVAALLAAMPLGAQTVVGRIVDAEGGGGVAGAFVVLADSTGHRRVAVLSDAEGRFVLDAPAPGTYSLRAERIGMTTRTVPGLALGPSERRSLIITLAADAVPLAAIEVSARRGRCELRPEAGAATARVWEEVRKALRVSAWARSAEVLFFSWRRHDRVLELPSRVVRSDSVSERSGYAERAVGAPLSPEEFVRQGYVRGDLVHGFEFSGPDEDVLASEEFLDSHCLELRPRADTPPGTLGIDFRPARRAGPPDIEGTAWLDEHSRELRSIEFTYARLSFPAEEAGGQVEYRRLPTGAWIVDRFRLTFPLMHLEQRGSMSVGAVHVAASQELKADALREVTFEVLDVRVPGEARPRLHADSTRAGVVTGQVYDSVHAQPLARAHVYLSGTIYAATADSAGRFRIAGVPAARYRVAFDHPVMDSLPVRPAPVDVDVPAGGEATVSLAVPGGLELRRRACPHDTPDPRRPLLFGRVAGAEGALVVRVLWQEIEWHVPHLVMRNRGEDMSLDDAGRFVVCAALPDHRPVTLRVVRQAADGRKLYGTPAELLPLRGSIMRVDLAAPKP